MSARRPSFMRLLTGGVIATATGAMTNIATSENSHAWMWLVVAVLTVGDVVLVFTERPTFPAAEPAEGRTGPDSGSDRRSAGRTVPLSVLAVTVAVLAACGAGGAGGVAAVNTVVNKVKTISWPDLGAFPGDRTPPEKPLVSRLVATATQREGPLRVTVTRVDVGANSIHVSLTAQNSSKDTLHLPLGQCQLAIQGTTTLAPEAMDSKWVQDVPPGQKIEGVIVFSGVPPSHSTTASLRFTTVAGSFEIDSITVSNIRIKG